MIAAASPTAEASASAVQDLVKQGGGTLGQMQVQPLSAPSFDTGAANIVASHSDAIGIVDISADLLVEAKALRSLGFNGPIVASPSPTDQVLQTINSPTFFGVHPVNGAAPGTLAYTTAQQYGLGAGTATGKDFTLAWLMTFLMVDGLKKCGFPCSSSSLEQAVDGLGSNITYPGEKIEYGSLTVSPKVHNILKTVQLYKWDSTSNAVVASGSPVDIGPVAYATSGG
jgi:hypothetical protein